MDQSMASFGTDTFIESLSLCELREWSRIDSGAVQSAIARNISARTEKIFWDLLALDYHSDNDQTWPLGFRFSIMRLRDITRQGMSIVEENQEREIPVTRKHFLSVSILMILEVAMIILRDPLRYLNKVEQLSRSVDYFETRLHEAMRLVL
ncbi:hypothetical protein M514_06139, partial [Trichuris suis]